MKENIQYDLIVIGAGPAGTTLATLVAMEGNKVLLLEKEKFPRYQIGESLLPATVHGICNLLKISDNLKKANFVKKLGAAFRWGKNDNIWTIGFSQAKHLNRIGANYAYQVTRREFDDILLKNAIDKGVDVKQQISVENIIEKNERIIGVKTKDNNKNTCIYNAKYTVDASGHKSNFHLLCGQRIYSDRLKNLAFFGYYKNIDTLPPPYNGNILIESFSEGWIWFIPLKHNDSLIASVGIIFSTKEKLNLKFEESDLDFYIKKCPKIYNLLKTAKHCHAKPYHKVRIRKDWTYTTEKFWKKGLILIGDSACFIDPVLSTGVHLATYSALLAARSINTALKTNEISEKDLFEEFEYRYRYEYDTLYKFITAFYNMEQNKDGYYWQAHNIIGGSEKIDKKESFISLLAGGVTSPTILIKNNKDLKEIMQKYANQLDISIPLKKRDDITQNLTKEVFFLNNSKGFLHSGSEDIKNFSWAKTESNALINNRMLKPSENGMYWRKK